jgi:hypothetical protein
MEYVHFDPPAITVGHDAVPIQFASRFYIFLIQAYLSGQGSCGGPSLGNLTFYPVVLAPTPSARELHIKSVKTELTNSVFTFLKCISLKVILSVSYLV